MVAGPWDSAEKSVRTGNSFFSGLLMVIASLSTAGVSTFLSRLTPAKESSPATPLIILSFATLVRPGMRSGSMESHLRTRTLYISTTSSAIDASFSPSLSPINRDERLVGRKRGLLGPSVSSRIAILRRWKSLAFSSMSSRNGRQRATSSLCLLVLSIYRARSNLQCLRRG